MKNKANIAVLVSGGGTNLQALLDAEKAGALKSGHITLVISNKAGAYALTRAENAGVKTATVLKKEYGSQEAFEAEILRLLEENEIDLIVLAGFLTILSPDFARRWDRRILNIQ